MTHRKLEEANSGTLSNDRSNKNTKSGKHSTGKNIIKGVCETGSAFNQSSLNLSSHLDYNLSASDSAENADTGSQKSKFMYSKSGLHSKFSKTGTLEDNFMNSRHTLELSEDDEDKIEEDDAFLFISNVSASANCMSKLKNSVKKENNLDDGFGELQNSKIIQDKIFIQQNYMEEIKNEINNDDFKDDIHQDSDNFNFFQVDFYNKSDEKKQEHVMKDEIEESKIVNTEPLELDYENQISPNHIHKIRVETDPNEEGFMNQSLLDNCRKLEIHTFAPKLLSEYYKQSINNCKRANN